MDEARRYMATVKALAAIATLWNAVRAMSGPGGPGIFYF